MNPSEKTLARLYRDEALYPVFQPIVDLRKGSIFGHEALIRGPLGTPFHTPAALLALAAEEDCLTEFELACVEVILRHWGRLTAPGQLFLNMSSDALAAAMEGPVPGRFERALALHGIAPRSVTVEITEDRPASHMGALRLAVKALHSTGARIALDDFGEGQSNLRLWSELRPDFVKIDKFFTHGIASSPHNLELVRTIVGFGHTLGTTLVAEGVEDTKDLRVLRDLGIDHGQGYLFGRPTRTLHAAAPSPIAEAIQDSRIAVMPHAAQQAQPGVLRSLAVIQAPTLGPATPIDEVSTLFQAHPELHALAVVDEGRPVALINRQSFMNDYARLYFREVHGRRPCIGYANTSPRVVELEDNVEQLVGILMSEDQRYLNDGFIVTEDKRYLGLGTGEQLVRAVTEARIEAARHANPLTFLPGNIPISIHIERLLASHAGFAACYADLNNFKVFNDHYGYWRGDEMIRMLARLAVKHADAHRDFVGHIGGDDFLVLFQSEDWQARCARMIEDFDLEALGLYDDAAREAGGIEGKDRHGTLHFFPFTTLSIGAVRIAPGRFAHAEDVAAEAAIAKHDAKHANTGLTVREPGAISPSKPGRAPYALPSSTMPPGSAVTSRR
ncbi:MULTISPECIES: phosphodiesterase [unclassified Variovorax]|uniref:phosphodiesterase n=1 Tax=unclassified Variovorax TaxID=663243 RepID=UPI0025790285|nr:MULTISPECIES: phosphodiesterase [unclassified Variovorax]MDM0089968.1 phosphodiesterase [Variovorax sp. J22G40]MDM0148366.1 phosphodiesterase [Variovorax sp. J2P1-31]